MFNNGEDLLVVSRGTGYIYNVKSNSWSYLHNNSLMDISWMTMATDPESGITYIPNGAMDYYGKEVVLALDARTGKSNAIPFPSMRLNDSIMAWCAPLRSFLVTPDLYNDFLYTFTPSKISESSNGWGMVGTEGTFSTSSYPSCFIPTYNGTKMVHIFIHPSMSTVYILDVATMTWKNASSTLGFYYVACAASGDQLIIWGLEGFKTSWRSNTTLVFNMKTGVWTSRYVAPTISSDHGDDSVTIHIIIIIVGVLLTIILTALSVYLGFTKRRNLYHQNTGSDDPIDPDSHTDSWSTLVPVGEKPHPEHPHTTVEDLISKRNVQEGAIDVESTIQHPHAVVADEDSAEYNVKVECRATDP
ncbi:MAG: hypothetical protein J3Q66DRAFT_360030 [Benniella sp.]|nr:MAG: hypothetical protein J3Q66DRAFT_360030 [Benniella sp.]